MEFGGTTSEQLVHTSMRLYAQVDHPYSCVPCHSELERLTSVRKTGPGGSGKTGLPELPGLARHADRRRSAAISGDGTTAQEPSKTTPGDRVSGPAEQSSNLSGQEHGADDEDS